MTDRDKKSSPSRKSSGRRKLLQGTLASGAAFTVDTWTKPVIKSVILPAHAQISPTPYAARTEETFVVEMVPDKPTRKG